MSAREAKHSPDQLWIRNTRCAAAAVCRHEAQGPNPRCGHDCGSYAFLARIMIRTRTRTGTGTGTRTRIRR